MATSPSSSRTWEYNVFTSFHGPDVRKTFLSHLRNQFNQNGITMFDDNGIPRSENIPSALIQGIRESRISIIVLSKMYASSRWCLDELLEILKCKEDVGKIVMTVFYGVDPSDVRNQTGDFGIAFNKTCARKTKEHGRKWSEALDYVGNIAGEHNWGNEAEMIAKIARDVSGETSHKEDDEESYKSQSGEASEEKDEGISDDGNHKSLSRKRLRITSAPIAVSFSMVAMLLLHQLVKRR